MSKSRKTHRKSKSGRKRKVSKRSRRHKRRHFGSDDSLLSIMGNFRPSAKMSYAQSTTGMSASQMRNHINGQSKSLQDNFYVNT